MVESGGVHYPQMNALMPGTIIAGLLFSSAWAKDCTVSKEFQLLHSQQLSAVLEDQMGAAISGYDLELIAGKRVIMRVETGNGGKYSFGEVAAGRYRIRVRHDGDPFCAPQVKCDQTNC